MDKIQIGLTCWRVSSVDYTGAKTVALFDNFYTAYQYAKLIAMVDVSVSIS